MCVGLSCNRFPPRVSFISAQYQYSFCVRWPYSPSSSPRGKELHKNLSLSLSLSALFVSALINLVCRNWRHAGKEEKNVCCCVLCVLAERHIQSIC